MVRLKAESVNFKHQKSIFQFLMVRLKVQLQSYLNQTQQDFNSLWCD